MKILTHNATGMKNDEIQDKKYTNYGVPKKLLFENSLRQSDS